MSEPTDLRDTRWRNLLDLDAAGEPLSADDRAFLASYEPRDPEVRVEQRFYGALGRLGDDDTIDANDETLLQGALQGFDGHAPAQMTTAISRRRIWIAVASGLAAASVAGVWRWLPDDGERDTADAPVIARTDVEPTPGETASPRVAAPEPAGESSTGAAVEPSIDTAAPAAESPVVVDSGRFVDGNGLVVPKGGAVDIGPVTAQTEGCLLAGELRSCFAAGTRMELRQGGDETEFAIGRGRVQVDGTTTLANVVYVVAGQRIETSGPTVFVIEAAADGHWSADVQSGELRIAEPGGGVSVVKARTRRRFGKDRPAVASAADLLAQARTRRGAGDIPGAIAAYEELILRYPNVAASRTAMVTLGQLRLDLGQAKKALRWFDRYVEAGGALAEDAQFGRIRALRALGRRADEREAIDAFLAKYPSGSYAAKLRGR